jgi:hypothetical protein
MSVEVTINPPTQINVTAQTENIYDITVSSPSVITVPVSNQTNPGVLPPYYNFVKQSTFDTHSTGLIEGGEIVITGYTTFNVLTGRGQVLDTINKIVEWDTATGLSTLYDGINYIRIDQDGLVSINQLPADHDNKIELGVIFTGGGNAYIIELASAPRRSDDLASRTLDFTNAALKAVVGQGLEVTEQAAPNYLKLNINSGTLLYNLDSRTLATTTSFYKVYKTADYGWIVSSDLPNIIQPDIYNDVTKPYGSALVSLTDSYWKKDLVFRVPSGNVYVICGQAQYGTKNDANNAPLPSLPSDIDQIATFLAVIVCEKSDISLVDRIADIRPIFSRIFNRSSLEEAYIPAGGTTSQALKKLGNGDFDVGWVTDDVPHGLDKEVQFNDNGVMGSDVNFLFNKDVGSLVVGKAELLPDNPIGLGGNVDSYLQANIQNKNEGISASADYIATADNGDDTENYIDMGISNSKYNVPEWDIAVADDGYFWVDGGNDIIGTMTPGKEILFFVAETIHEAHPADTIAKMGTDYGLNVVKGHVQENGFNLSDMIVECDSTTAETTAFALGSKIVIRTDLL